MTDKEKIESLIQEVYLLREVIAIVGDYHRFFPKDAEEYKHLADKEHEKRNETK